MVIEGKSTLEAAARKVFYSCKAWSGQMEMILVSAERHMKRADGPQQSMG